MQPKVLLIIIVNIMKFAVGSAFSAVLAIIVILNLIPQTDCSACKVDRVYASTIVKCDKCCGDGVIDRCDVSVMLMKLVAKNYSSHQNN